MADLAGFSALVLGAAEGMGRATAEAFAADGARVALADIQLSVAEETAQLLGPTSSAHHVDAADPASVADLFSEVLALHGRLDAIVNVIGGSRMIPVHETTLDDLEGIFRLNFVHHWVVISEAVRRLDAASYVGLSSICGLSSAVDEGAYGAAKAAFQSLIRTSAQEYGARGFRFNAVAPGVIATPRIANSGYNAGELKQTMVARIPAGRYGEASEIAAAAVFLSGPGASYISGQVLTVDGAVSITYPLPTVNFLR